MNKSRILYATAYPKLSNIFIKLEQISNYTIIHKSELSSGPQSLELSLLKMLCVKDYHSHFQQSKIEHNSHFRKSSETSL